MPDIPSTPSTALARRDRSIPSRRAAQEAEAECDPQIVNAQTMREIAPTFTGAQAASQAKIISEAGAVLAATLESYDITSRLRIAHFLGQTCEESAGYRTTEEFASGREYEGRADLGNNQKGDGPRYKGRGLLQLTGRANYTDYGKALGVDLVNNPTLAAQPALSLKIACEYWKRHNINADCDRDDVQAVTRKVNGGLNGLADRIAFTQKAKAAVARLQAIALSGAASAGAVSGAAAPGATASAGAAAAGVASAPPRPVLARGSQGDGVVQLQNMLRDLNFAVAIDGDFGPGTEVAVTRFQSENGLADDGIVGPLTWSALDAAKKKA
jgi:putative chitinase